MSRNSRNKADKKTAGTQTQEIDAELEIARLQEQVKLLKIENEVLRKYTTGKPENVQKYMPENTTDDTRVSPGIILEESRQRNARASSIVKSAVKNTLKGCSCKGNCSSKICGCMKRDNKCGESCKCNNSVCQNQSPINEEVDKENVDNGNTDISQVNARKTKGVTNKHLKNVNRSKGLFSPDVAGPDIDLNSEGFRTMSLQFGPPKTLNFGSDEEDKQEKDKPEKGTGRHKSRRRPNYNEEEEEEVQEDRIKSKQKNLEIPKSKHNRKTRSSSNEEKRVQSNLAVDEQSIRRSSSEMDIERNYDEIVVEKPEKRKKYLENVIRGMESIRKKKAEATEELPPSSTTEENMETKLEQRSKRRDRQQGGKKTVKAKDNSETTNKDKSPVEESVVKTRREKHYIVESSSEEENNVPTIVHQGEMDITEVKEEINFDPMKPKHQLQRTPTHGTKPSVQNDPNIFLSFSGFIQKEQEEEEDVVVPDFEEPEVNWEEYQSRLVACGKCKRKFHPLRVKKHELCCKKV